MHYQFNTQLNIIKTICSHIIEVATKTDQSLEPKAKNVADKFQHVLELFAECHTVYDSSSLLSDTEMQSLGNQNSVQKIKCKNVSYLDSQGRKLMNSLPVIDLPFLKLPLHQSFIC